MNRLLSIIFITAALFFVMAYNSGVQFYQNSTAQRPGGFFLVVSRPVMVGDYVEACLPHLISPYAILHHYIDAGFQCPNQTAPTFKKVVALGGAVVEINKDSIVINDKPLGYSATREKDDADLNIPAISRDVMTLRNTDMWLHYAHDKSYDSRYFGPISQQYIVRVLKPIFTW